MNNGQSPQATSPKYLDTFSLTSAPFENRIDPRFFYAGSALVQRLDLLTHLTQFGDSVILVSGPAGSGKSTLLDRFIGQPGSHWQLCPMDADKFDQFSARLAQVTGIDGTGSEQELVAQWANQTDVSQLLVIVIDNAERLDAADIDRLGGLLGQAEAERVRLILFATPDVHQPFKQVLERQAHPRTTQVLEVPRLSEEETASYLMYRLAVAGYSGESPFTPTEVRAICKAADGRPADINRLADEALLEHYERSKSKRIRTDRVGRKGLSPFFWAAASLSVVALAAYLGSQRLDTDSATDDAPVALAPTEELPLKLPELVPPAPAPQTDEAPPAPLPDVALTPLPAEPAPQPAADDTPPATQIAGSAGDPEPAVGETAMPEKNVEAAKPAGDETEPGLVAVAPAESPVAAVASDADTPMAEVASDKTALKQVIHEQPAAAAVSSERIEKEPQTVPSPQRETWLLAQPENAFSLQLLGSRTEKSVTDFIAEHKLDVKQTA
jgi:type II secretory pathway predicted ATPase ExeA